MANNNFRNVDEFIDGFTRTDPYEKGLYEFVFWGLEFEYHGKFYRLSRDQSGDDAFTESVRRKFNKPNGAIELYRLPKEDHFGNYALTVDIFVGIYDDIRDLLESKDIEGIPFKDLIVSSETRITSMD